MTDKLADYRQADTPLPQRNRLWPLYGAGFENLGRAGAHDRATAALLWAGRIVGAP